MKNVTIKDVAKAAGVSPSTVSRVLSDSKRISQETKDRVRKIMKELGYHQNAIARSLVTRRTDSIALVMARPTQQAFDNPFFSMIIQGISLVTQKKHYSLVLSSTADYHEEQEETMKLIRNRRVDGVILMASRNNDHLIKKLLELKFPFVLIGRSPEHEDIPRINNNNFKAAYDTSSYLIKNNYKKILALSGPEEYIVSQDRVAGYKKALEDYGYQENIKVVYTDDFTYQDGYNSTLNLIEDRKDSLDAIFAFDDMIALGAIRALQSLNLKVPEHLAIIGFNDDPIASYMKPALTTVKIPIVEMGEAAAAMLIRMLGEENYNGEGKILDTELIIRESFK